MPCSQPVRLQGASGDGMGGTHYLHLVHPNIYSGLSANSARARPHPQYTPTTYTHTHTHCTHTLHTPTVHTLYTHTAHTHSTHTHTRCTHILHTPTVHTHTVHAAHTHCTTYCAHSFAPYTEDSSPPHSAHKGNKGICQWQCRIPGITSYPIKIAT